MILFYLWICLFSLIFDTHLEIELMETLRDTFWHFPGKIKIAFKIVGTIWYCVIPLGFSFQYWKLFKIVSVERKYKLSQNCKLPI